MVNLTNIRDHPEDINYLIYWFRQLERADYLENLLKDSEVGYQRESEEVEEKGTVHYFIVHRRFEKQMTKYNNLTLGHFRENFIPNRWAAWITIILTALVIFIALYGYLRSR